MKNRGNTGKKRAKGDRGQAEGSSNLSSGVKPTQSVAGVIPEGAVAPATNGTTSGTGVVTQPNFSLAKKFNDLDIKDQKKKLTCTFSQLLQTSLGIVQ